LKKSPTGSAFAERPLKNKSATARKQIQWAEMKRVIELSAFNVEPSLSPSITPQEKKIFSARGARSTAPRQNG
jgi:hypothetical protein